MSQTGYPGYNRDPGFNAGPAARAAAQRAGVKDRSPNRDPGINAGPGTRRAARGAMGGGNHPPAPARHPAPTLPAKIYDPFAPVTEQQMEQRANVYGPVQTEQQIQRTAGREARAQVSPLLKQITGNITAQSTAAQANLAGATRNYQDQAAKYAPAVADAYQSAEARQGTVDQALAAALQQNGGSYGQGMANASLAGGSAELSRLLSNETSARQYGAQLPVIAANAGNQRAGQVAGQYADQLRTETSDLNSKIPGLVAGLLTDLHATNDTRRSNRATALNQERDRATNAAVFRKEYGLKEQSAQATAQHNAQSDAARQQANRISAARVGVQAQHNQASDQTAAQRAAVSAQTAAERARHDRAAERQARISARAQGRQIDPALSAQKGIVVGKDGKPILQYHLDSNGKRIPGSGRTIPYRAKRAGKSKGKGGAGASGLGKTGG